MILASYQVKSSDQIQQGETGTMIYDADHPVKMVDKVKKGTWSKTRIVTNKLHR